jgi:hypothetical protein
MVLVGCCLVFVDELQGFASGGVEADTPPDVVKAPFPFPESERVLVIVDTSPAVSIVVGNSISVMVAPAMPVVTTVTVRVILVNPELVVFSKALPLLGRC